MNKHRLYLCKLSAARFWAAMNIGMTITNRRTFGDATMWTFFGEQP